MTRQSGKLSEILKTMAEQVLRDPKAAHSSEAAHVALMFANFARNECVGLDHAREGYRSAWETIEAKNPQMWSEFRSTDVNALIDELVEYKKTHHPDDLRRILMCGILNGAIRVEWVRAAAPGVDSKWEMQLFGLVKMGEREKAIQFLRETRRLSRSDAAAKVVAVAAELGIR